MSRMKGRLESDSDSAANNAAEDEWITSQSTIRNAVDNLYQIAVASRGPFGGAHLFHSNPSAPIIHLTQTCSTLFSSISHAPSNVVWNLVQSLLQRNLDQLADGGWSMVQLIAGLARINHHRPFTHSSLSSLGGVHSSPSVLSSPQQQQQHAPTAELVASMRIAPTFIPVHIALAGYQLALGWCLEFLQEDFVTKQKQAQPTAASSSSANASAPHPVIAFSMSNLPLLLNVIRSQFASKQALLQLSSDENQYLSVLCVEAFLKGLNDPSAGSGSNGGFASNIRVHEVNHNSDKSVMDCKVFDGIVLDIPLPIHHRVSQNPAQRSPSALRSYENLRTIIYNINLTFDPKELFSKDLLIHQTTSYSASGTTGSGATQYEEQLHAMMNALVEVWQKRSVNCVLSQKVIHPYLKQRCLHLGILPLERLSIRHIETALSLAGGDLLSGIDLSTAKQAKLGFISSLQEKLIGKRRYLFLSNTGASHPSAPAASPSICTFVVSARTSMQRAELVLTLTRLFKILTHLLRSPFVCAGGGSTEMSLAAELQRRILDRMKTKRAFYQQSLATVAQKIAAKYSKAPQSLVSQLAQAELELFRQHLQGLERSDRLLHESIKHFSEVLQDLACETVFRRNSLSGASSDNNQLLYEELKQLLRQYYNFPDVESQLAFATDFRSHQFSSTAPTKTSSMTAQKTPTSIHESSHSTEQPSKSQQISTSAGTSGSSTSIPDSSDNAITLFPHALLSPDAPLDETKSSTVWNPGADWLLQYETEHIFDEKITSVLAEAEIYSPAKVDRDPLVLYGFHAMSLITQPVPVFRRSPVTNATQSQSSTPVIKIDENTILDPLYVKRAVIQVAVEAAGVLLKVDHIVPNAQ